MQPMGCLLCENLGMDDVFRALADPSRRRLLASLNERNGQTLRELCGSLSSARQSVSKHLAVLEAAHLVVAERRGREKLHFLNAEPIKVIASGLLETYEHAPTQPPYRWASWHEVLAQP
jgi:DNA-binding transcriptional ArsR family regulator